MKSKCHLILYSIFKAVFLLLLGLTPVLAQTPDKIVLWSDSPIGRMARADDPRLSQVEHALEIIDIAVDGKSILIGEGFSSNDNWIRNLTVRVRNISGQPIHSIQMGFVLPDDSLNDGRNIGFALRGGSTPAGKREAIMPGEEVELKWLEVEYQKFQGLAAQLKGTPSFRKVKITMTGVLFTNGTHWISDCFKATNPRNSCPHSESK